MAYQKLQVSRALQVIPSDTINIPNVSHRSAQGTTDSYVSSKLCDSSATFTNGNVKVNDIVYNTTTSAIARVIAIDSDDKLSLSANAFASSPANYEIYRDTNDGCILYVGGLGNVEVVTVGGDKIVLPGISAGSFLPIQVTRVKATSTTATNIIALW